MEWFSYSSFCIRASTLVLKAIKPLIADSIPCLFSPYARRIMYISNILFGFPLLLFTELKIFNDLLPIHPAIIKVLVVLSYGPINRVSYDHFQRRLRHQTPSFGLSYSLPQETYSKMHQCHCQRSTVDPFLLLPIFLDSMSLGSCNIWRRCGLHCSAFHCCHASVKLSYIRVRGSNTDH